MTHIKKIRILALAFSAIAIAQAHAQADDSFYQDGYKISVTSMGTVTVLDGNTEIAKIPTAGAAYRAGLDTANRFALAISAAKNGGATLYRPVDKSGKLKGTDVFLYDKDHQLVSKFYNDAPADAEALKSGMDAVVNSAQARCRV